MSDVYEHNLGDHEDPMSGPTWLVGFVGMIILIVIILAVTAVLKFTVSQVEQQALIELDVAELTAVKQRDFERLHSGPRIVEYVDVDGNVQTRLAIPIDRAIEQLAEDWSAGEPTTAAVGQPAGGG